VGYFFKSADSMTSRDPKLMVVTRNSCLRVDNILDVCHKNSSMKPQLGYPLA